MAMTLIPINRLRGTVIFANKIFPRESLMYARISKSSEILRTSKALGLYPTPVTPDVMTRITAVAIITTINSLRVNLIKEGF